MIKTSKPHCPKCKPKFLSRIYIGSSRHNIFHPTIMGCVKCRSLYMTKSSINHKMMIETITIVKELFLPEEKEEPKEIQTKESQ